MLFSILLYLYLEIPKSSEIISWSVMPLISLTHLSIEPVFFDDILSNALRILIFFRTFSVKSSKCCSHRYNTYSVTTPLTYSISAALLNVIIFRIKIWQLTFLSTLTSNLSISIPILYIFFKSVPVIIVRPDSLFAYSSLVISKSDAILTWSYPNNFLDIFNLSQNAL